jgi:hypothetical protein
MNTRARAVLLCLAAGTTFCAGLSPAFGTIVRWNLKDVKFDDGGAASGFVVLDVNETGNGASPGTNPQLVDWDIKVSGGNEADFAPFEYTPASTFESSSDLEILDGVMRYTQLRFATHPKHPGLLQHRFLVLATDPQLSSAGGAVRLTMSPPATDGSRESWNFLPNRYAFGGMVAVPEPPTVAMAWGVAMLIAFRARVLKALRKSRHCASS